MTQAVFDKAVELKDMIESFSKAHNAIIDAYNQLFRSSKSITEEDIVAFVHTIVKETGGELELLAIIKCATETIEAKCKQLKEEFAEL